MIVIKYEDLKKDTVKELKRFCKFVNIDRDEDYLKLIAEKTSFEKMQKKERGC